MKKKKICRGNKNKETNTIIEIRKEILEMLREFHDKIDDKFLSKQEKDSCKAEVRQIAEIIRDKDKYMLKLERLGKAKKSEKEINDENINKIRTQIIGLLYKKRNSITMNQYDSKEFQIIDKELMETEKLITEKDRIWVKSERSIQEYKKPAINPHLYKFFKMEPENEL